MTLNLLFVCSQNKWRSPTAENIYRHDSRVKTRSAGTSSSAIKKISESDLNWADLILVMEYKHQKIITSRYRYLDLPKILVLDIPDDYQYMSPDLVEILESSVEEILLSCLDRDCDLKVER